MSASTVIFLVGGVVGLGFGSLFVYLLRKELDRWVFLLPVLVVSVFVIIGLATLIEERRDLNCLAWTEEYDLDRLRIAGQCVGIDSDGRIKVREED